MQSQSIYIAIEEVDCVLDARFEHIPKHQIFGVNSPPSFEEMRREEKRGEEKRREEKREKTEKERERENASHGS